MSRYEPTRDEINEEATASHHRAMSEERDEPMHEWRLRQIREIAQGMKSILAWPNNDIRDSEPF